MVLTVNYTEENLLMMCFKQFGIVLFVIITLGCFVLPGLARVPYLINYQGRLSDNLGNPVADDEYSITFRVYDSESGGEVLWQEDRNIKTTDGVYHILLGAGKAAVGSFTPELFSSDARWLEVEVGGEVMTPRQRIARRFLFFRRNNSKRHYKSHRGRYSRVGGRVQIFKA